MHECKFVFIFMNIPNPHSVMLLLEISFKWDLQFHLGKKHVYSTITRKAETINTILKVNGIMTQNNKRKRHIKQINNNKNNPTYLHLSTSYSRDKYSSPFIFGCLFYFCHLFFCLLHILSMNNTKKDQILCPGD